MALGSSRFRISIAVLVLWAMLMLVCLWMAACAGAASSQGFDGPQEERLGEDEAVGLFSRVFGPYMPTRGSLSIEASRVEKFLSDHAALVREGKTSKLIEATVPLRTENRSGRLRPVDFRLRRYAETLRPQNPLVPVSLPMKLGQGITLPSFEFGVRLPDADPKATPFVIDGSVAIYPNAERNASFAVVPLPTGLETFSMLHSTSAPHSQRFGLDLPAGAVLQATPEGGAQVTRSGRALIAVPPPTAFDANLRPMPTTMEVGASSLTVEVHPTVGAEYPLLVDPIYQTYNWTGGSTSGLSDWTKTSNTSVYVPATQLNCGSNCLSSQTKGAPGLYVGAASGSVTPGSTAYWSYFVPRYQSDKSKYGQLPTSFISKADFSSTAFLHRSDSAMSPVLFAGLWKSTDAPYLGGPNNWVSQKIRYGSEPDWTGGSFTLTNPTSNKSTKWLMAGMSAIDSHALSAYRDAYFGAVEIELSDSDKPALTEVVSPTGWFDQVAPSPIPATAEDTGLGLSSFTSKETVAPFNSWQYSLNCSGTASNPCPRVWKSSEGSPTLVAWPMALPEGLSKIAITASDPVGNVSEPSYIDVKIDHSAPKVTLSGSLTEPGLKRLDPGEYDLHVAATDGTVSAPRSGVKSIAIEVDGVVVPGTVEQACPSGSCSASRDWTFDVSNYTSGEHAVRIIVKDHVGRQAKSELKVTVDKSRIYWGAWMDGDVQLLKTPPQPPIGDAPWEKATWEEFKEHADGKYPSIIHFGQPPPWQQQFFPGPFNLVYEKKAIPLLSMGSWKASLEDIAKGEGEEFEAFEEWFEDAKAYGMPFFFRWNWEMNLEPTEELPWTEQIAPDPAVFVAAWQKLRQVADEKGATNITWVWCPNTSYGSYPAGSTPLSQLWPGSQYVDWTCIDGYNWGENELQPDEWKSFSKVFAKTYGEVTALAPTKPMMIGETASTEVGGGKATWITNALSKEIPLEFPGIKALVWFNWNIEKGGGGKRLDWPIESSASAREAFAAGVASANYAPGEFESLPSLSRIQPLP